LTAIANKHAADNAAFVGAFDTATERVAALVILSGDAQGHSDAVDTK
jgi:hypothetical protein